MSAEHTGVSGLSGRYATALFDLADDRRRLDEVADDLVALQAMIDASDDLRRLIRSPVIPRADQERAVIAVLTRAGASDLTRNFIGVVARNHRLFALERMIADFRTLLARRRGQVTAEVTTAAALSERQMQALSEVLRRATGSSIDVRARVDPALIGGLVVKIESRMVDSSLRTKLNKLQSALKGAA